MGHMDICVGDCPRWGSSKCKGPEARASWSAMAGVPSVKGRDLAVRPEMGEVQIVPALAGHDEELFFILSRVGRLPAVFELRSAMI